LYIVLARQRAIKAEHDKAETDAGRTIETLKRRNLNRLTKRATDKSELEVEEDFFTLTCFSYLKVNADVKDGWGIKPEKQS